MSSSSTVYNPKIACIWVSKLIFTPSSVSQQSKNVLYIVGLKSKTCYLHIQSSLFESFAGFSFPEGILELQDLITGNIETSNTGGACSSHVFCIGAIQTNLSMMSTINHNRTPRQRNKEKIFTPRFAIAIGDL